MTMKRFVFAVSVLMSSVCAFPRYSFDFAIPVGLSFENSNVVLDARYNIGVMKMVDGDDTKNSVFQFTFGYKFSL